jgi:DNA-binding protein YbaB
MMQRRTREAMAMMPRRGPGRGRPAATTPPGFQPFFGGTGRPDPDQAHQRLRPAKLMVTRASEDGRVTVTVDEDREVVDVVFDPSIYDREDATELAQALVRTVRAAIAEADRCLAHMTVEAARARAARTMPVPTDGGRC